MQKQNSPETRAAGFSSLCRTERKPINGKFRLIAGKGVKIAIKLKIGIDIP